MRYSKWIHKRIKCLHVFPGELPPDLKGAIDKWEAIYRENLDKDDSVKSKALKNARKAMARLDSKVRTEALRRACDGTCYICMKPLSYGDTVRDLVRNPKSGAPTTTMPAHRFCSRAKRKREPSEGEIERARRAHEIANLRFFDQPHEEFYREQAQGRVEWRDPTEVTE